MKAVDKILGESEKVPPVEALRVYKMLFVAYCDAGFTATAQFLPIFGEKTHWIYSVEDFDQFIERCEFDLYTDPLNTADVRVHGNIYLQKDGDPREVMNLFVEVSERFVSNGTSWAERPLNMFPETRVDRKRQGFSEDILGWVNIGDPFGDGYPGIVTLYTYGTQLWPEHDN